MNKDLQEEEISYSLVSINSQDSQQTMKNQKSPKNLLDINKQQSQTDTIFSDFRNTSSQLQELKAQSQKNKQFRQKSERQKHECSLCQLCLSSYKISINIISVSGGYIINGNGQGKRIKYEINNNLLYANKNTKMTHYKTIE
ncbi:hypothetical protein PPERSA_11277 [Pseudocohnilembus persalinus]|uniref:Uncharacterized protein n=1 Tax=Pseudocohnilembus persalinus TaxID=266149 RepID=A0A0V0QPF6_PSEPJ|nr:hypothetical protein PPERSA_11277 [Pseudocohnilembus persalinus]|eukprot:KRX04153.1 hypothetical protein PPERSA_11277 [Pseudocohnilembus persalinus]